MIQITVQKESYIYNVYHLVKAFYSAQEISSCAEEKASVFVSVDFTDRIEAAAAWSLTFPEMPKSELDLALYETLSKRTGRELPWGVLQGVRPTKLAMKGAEAGLAKAEFVQRFYRDKRVSREKAELAYDIAVRERKILSGIDYRDGFSLYIGIPFCPSICSYCSFGSGELAAYADVVPAYVDALCREIAAVAEMTGDKKLNTIYFGGGTPTTLSAAQLAQVQQTIAAHFSFDHLLEYTVEAGRPDTITADKLAVLKRSGVTRISINPQTMQQQTLDVIGRRHSVAEVYSAFDLAREAGFDNINMDLIAGLPGEDLPMMEDTLRQVETIGPESLTVHSLAIKRAARLEHQTTPGSVVEKMVSSARAAAAGMQMQPYYLYRQKSIAGNFENTGYAKVDKAGIYNILIMEEKQTIIACGAGAQSKVVLPEKIRTAKGKETSLLRVDNVKNIREYITRVDEMIQRKGDLLWH